MGLKIGVTVEDVLKTISVCLQKSSSQCERVVTLIEDPWMGIEAAVEDSAGTEEGSGGPRRIDYLRGRKRIQILPKLPLPEDDDGISPPFPHDPTSNIPVSIRLLTLLSRGFRWLFGMPSTVETVRLPDAATTCRLDTRTIRLPDDEEDKSKRPMSKRRALLVGINYRGDHNEWPALDGPHKDVEDMRQLLIDTLGYRPEDVTVLKDDPNLPDLLYPTRVNMIHELKRLVSDAMPGDTFVFSYSGHSDQQPAIDDFGEEDGQDEIIITSDEQSILNNELNDILLPLPIDCSLLAILDTCHSGTLLDLPHYHCNSVYVPWQSKDTRRKLTMQNNNVRRQAMDFAKFTPPDQSLPSFATINMDLQEPGDRSTRLPLRANDGASEGRSVDQRKTSLVAQSRETRRPPELSLFPSQPHCALPDPLFVCNGWCDRGDNPYPTVLSLSACSDLQRAREGPNGSLTTILCNYLKTHIRPSYRELMSYIKYVCFLFALSRVLMCHLVL
ncbi:caspase domain-containing protein [Lactarius psammicola]|nr:caspase domain-containing protein [Lactarius psammicola]